MYVWVWQKVKEHTSKRCTEYKKIEGKERKTKDSMSTCRKGGGEERGGGGVKTAVLN